MAADGIAGGGGRGTGVRGGVTMRAVSLFRSFSLSRTHGGPVSAVAARTASEASALRFHLAVQRSRFAVLLLMGLVSAVARLLGLIHFSIPAAAAAASAAYLSVPVFMALHRGARSFEEHRRIHLA